MGATEEEEEEDECNYCNTYSWDDEVAACDGFGTVKRQGLGIQERRDATEEEDHSRLCLTHGVHSSEYYVVHLVV